MALDEYNDVNVILLPNQEKEMESMIEDYLDVLEDCKTRQEIEAVIRLVAQDARTITLREICTRKIQALAKVLEETTNVENW